MFTLRRWAALCVGAVLAGLLTVVVAPQAEAAQGGLPASTASMWQTNGVVRAMVYTNGVLYVGGDFTSVRPPGSAAGSNETTRNGLAAFDANTGALITSFNPNMSSGVRALALSPDKSILYAGGDFTSVGGTARTRLASFTLSSGALTSWAPTADGRVWSIAATASQVYVGGSFGRLTGQGPSWIGAVSTTTGARNTAFAPAVDSTVYTVAVSPSGDKVYAGGAFTQTNGDTNRPSAAVLNPANGATLPFAAGAVIPIPSPSCVSQTKNIQVDADSVYFAQEGTGGGCFDGTFASNQSDGSLKWVSRCLGASQGLAVLNGMLYVASHAHDCSADQGFDPDAFPEIGWSKGLSRHLTARSTTDGKIGTWFPNTNGGIGEGLGPRVFATDGTQLFSGGEFTTVNGVAQQGLTRFSPSASPNAVPARPAAPSVVVRGGGKVSVFVQTPLDIDDVDLVVRLYRGSSNTPIATAPAHSLFWKQPIIGFEDTGVASGSQTYSIDVAQANGTGVSTRSPSTTVTFPAALSGYQAAVAADNPTLDWRLGDPGGFAAGDASTSLDGGTFRGSPTYGQPGAIPGNNAVRFNGTDATVNSEQLKPGPAAFSVEAWINTTTTSGGKIVGFGDNRGGLDFGGNPTVSGQYDKHMYMTNDGHVLFGVFTGATVTLSSSAALNDGQWHHLVGTQNAGGMSFYVDGVRQGKNGTATNQAYNGYWRVGGDNLGGWPSQPSSNFFAGLIDDVAVYPTALSASAVVAHYNASGRTAQAPALPTDPYGSAVVADGANSLWRLDEASGTAATDASTNGNDGVYVPNVTYGVAGALGAQGKAVTLDGSTGGVSSANSTSGPAVFSAELWFKTNTTTGGKLIGFGNAQTGNSSGYDKHVYMTNDGKLTFGVYNGSFDTISTAAAYNDGQWHHVVATQGSGGMTLYVDDQLAGTNPVTTNQAYDGYWRVGGDNLGAWPNRPSTDWFSGSVDEAAIYPTVLDAAAVDRHYRASGRSGPPDTTAPTAAITSPAANATLTAGTVPVTVNAADNVGVTSVDVLVDNAVVGTATTAPYTVNWTAAPGAHTITAAAKDAAGNVGNAAPVSVTVNPPPDTTPPSAVSNLASSNVTATGATLTWTAATDNVGVTGYVVSRNGSDLPGTVTATTFTDSGLTSSTAYQYTVRAVDAANNQGPASPLTVTTAAAPGFTDTFTGTNGAAWASPWVTSVSSGSATIDSNTGLLAYTDTANAYARAQLNTTAQSDTDLLTSFQWTSNTAAAYLNVYVKGSGGWQNGYRPKYGYGVQLQSNSGTALLQKNVNGTTTTLATVNSAQTVGTGKQWLRLQSVGSTVRFKIWADGTSEPAAWTSSVSDNTVTAAGQVFVSLNRASTNTGNKSVRLDDVAVNPITP